MDGQDACSSPAYDHKDCLAVPSHVVHLWDIPNHRLVATIPPDIDVKESPAFLPQSRILFAGADLVVWNWARRTILEKIRLPGTRFHAVALTPTGDRAFVSVEGGSDILVFDAEKKPCLPSISGLTNYYSGDGTLDDSQGVGSLVSDAAPDFAPGWSGQAFRFTGTGGFLKAVAGGTYCTFCSDEWTESLRVKLNSTVGEMTLLEHNGRQPSSTRRLYATQDHFVVTVGGGAFIPSLAPIKADKWYHITIVGDPHRVSLYVDGTLQGEAALTQPSIENDRSSVLIGASPGKRNAFNGLVDELAVYGRALRPDEVKALSQDCRPTS